MKDENKLVITIGRQFGSGGCEVGTKLAQELGLDFYDKNILRMNSDESGIEESFYYLADEKAGNKLLYKIIKSLTPEKGAPSFGSDLISADNLFRFQSEVIRSWPLKKTALSWAAALIMFWKPGRPGAHIYLCRHGFQGKTYH